MNPCLGRNFEAMDPLEWLRCDQRMSILAFVSDQHSISRVLEHLGLRPALVVILSTGTEPEPARDSDFTAVLVKPYSLVEFARLLSRLLAEASAVTSRDRS